MKNMKWTVGKLLSVAVIALFIAGMVAAIGVPAEGDPEVPAIVSVDYCTDTDGKMYVTVTGFEDHESISYRINTFIKGNTAIKDSGFVINTSDKSAYLTAYTHTLQVTDESSNKYNYTISLYDVSLKSNGSSFEGKDFRISEDYLGDYAMPEGYIWNTKADPTAEGAKWVTKLDLSLVSGTSITLYAFEGESALTIDPISPLTYNSEEQTVTPVVKNYNGDVAVKDVDYTIDIESVLSAEDAGTYTISITGIGGYEGAEDSVEWEILPVEVTVSGITANDKVYDGDAEAVLVFDDVVIDGMIAGDDLSVTAEGDFADKNVGEDKTVTISYLALIGDDAGNYVLAGEGQQTSATADITPKAVTVSGIIANNKVYDGTADAELDLSEVEFAGIVLGDVLSVTAEGAFADKNVGEGKTVTISGLTLGGADKGNYVLAGEGQQTSATANITQLEATLSWGADVFVYNGKEQCPTATVSNLIEGDDCTVTITGAKKDAGEYPATASALAGDDAGNYKLPAVKTWDYTISQKDVTVKADDKTMGQGQEVPTLTATVTGLVEGESASLITYELATTATSESPKGTYDITVTGPASQGNYNVSSFVKGTLTIKPSEKAKWSTEPVGAKDLVFNNGDQNLLAVYGKSDDGTVMYKIDDGAYSTAVPTAKNAKTYTVSCYIQGDEDHLDSDVKVIEVEIAKAEPIYTAPTSKGPTYTGEAQELINAGVSENGTFTYSLDDVSYGADIPKGTLAGNYTVYWKLTGDANHKNASGSVNVTVAKANYDMSGVSMSDVTVPYDGQEHNIAVTGVLPTGLDGIQVTVSYTGPQTSAGKYTVTATFATESTNYNVPEPMAATLTIYLNFAEGFLEDHSKTPVKDLFKEYGVTSYSVTDGVISVTIAAEDLIVHANANDMMAYWVGFAVLKNPMTGVASGGWYNISKDGFVLDDWTAFDAEGTGSSNKDPSFAFYTNMKGADKTFYVALKWQSGELIEIEKYIVTFKASLVGYTLSYDSNDGSDDIVVDDRTFYYGIGQDLKANTFVRPGYLFQGWSTSPDGEVEYADGAEYALNVRGNVKLYAIWAQNFAEGYLEDHSEVPVEDLYTKYGVTSYSVKDGVISVTVAAEGLIVHANANDMMAYWVGFAVLKNPMTGKASGGWYNISKDKFVEDDWTAFDAEGTGSSNKDPSFAIYTNMKGEDKTYYLSLKWQSGESFLVEKYLLTFKADLVGYTLSYDSNDGSDDIVVDDRTFYYGIGQDLKANTFVRPGYAFQGWSTSPVGEVEYADGAEYALNVRGNVKLYAIWAQNFAEGYLEDHSATPIEDLFTKYGVTSYSVKDGVISVTITAEGLIAHANANDMMAYWVGFAVLKNPMTGKASGGWYTISKEAFDLENWEEFEAEGTGSSNKDPSFAFYTNMKGADKTFYVALKWQSGELVKIEKYLVTFKADLVGYTVTYNANGGEGTMSAETFYVEIEKALTKNAFTKEGFLFQGWSTSPDGDVQYHDGDKFNLTVRNDVTLYAKWGKEPTPVAKPTAENFTYDGTEKIGVESHVGYTLGGTFKATDAGNYTATATLDAGYIWADGSSDVLELEWTIAKAKIEPKVTIEGWTYGQEAKTPVVTGNPGEGTVTITYAVKGSTEYSEKVPATAGDYTVKATVAETKNYLGGEATSDFTIAKADYDMSKVKWDYSGTPFTYDGTEKTVSVTGELPVGVTVAAYADNAKTDAGEYTASVTFAYDEVNYNKPTISDCGWKIDKAKIEPKVTIEGWTYGQDAKTPVVTGNPGEGAVAFTYAVKGSTEYSEKVPTDAGEYTVKATVAETKNYLGGEATCDFTIAKAAIEPKVTIEGWAYGSEPSTPVVTGNPGEGEVTITYAVKGSTEYSKQVPTEIGEYTVKATIAETKNYLGGEATCDFAITGKTVAKPEAIKDLEYNGSSQTGVPSATGYTLMGETAVNAGDYTAKAILDEGYVWTDGSSDPVDVKWSIAKKALDNSMLTVTADFIYDGTEHTVSYTVSDKSGDKEIITSADYAVTSGDKGTNAGQYALIIDATESGNYKGQMNAAWSIAQKKATVTADDKEKEIGKEDPTLTATVTGVIDDFAIVYTVTRAAGEDVGTYAITPFGEVSQGNYTVEYVDGVFSIVYAERTITDATGKISATGEIAEGAELVVVSKYDPADWETVDLTGKDIVKGLDISISSATTPAYTGTLDITIELGSKYNGSKITVYHHLEDGSVESFTKTVHGGKVTITVSDLSPFLVAMERASPYIPSGDTTIVTGSDANLTVLLAFATLTLSLIGLAVVIYKRK